MDGVDLRQLECFIVVAEEMHMGRAAARLHMTQPPLTRRIARLERALDVTLFERMPSGLTLTDAGGVLLERAYRLVQLAEHAVQRTRRAADGEVGHIVVGYFGSTVFAAAGLLERFLATRPDVAVTLERAGKDVQADALRDGRMHIGFGRRYQDEAGLRVSRIGTDPLYLALPASHPLVGSGEVRVSDLRHLNLVLFPSGPRPSFADSVTALCTAAGFTARVAREAEDVVTAVAYVAASKLAAVVPRSATSIALPGLAYVHIADAAPADLSVMYRAGATSPVLQAFLTHLTVGDPSRPSSVSTAIPSAHSDRD